MPISRYRKNKIVTTSDIQYQEVLKQRGVAQISHYSFEKFKTLKLKDLSTVTILNHTWAFSDRYYKLAAEYYSDPTYWWIIAYFNNAPLENDLKIGQTILIPVPLEQILIALEY